MIEPRYVKIEGVFKDPAIGALDFGYKAPKMSKEKKALLKQLAKVQNEIDKLYDKIKRMK